MNTLSKNKILSKHKVKHKNKIKYKVKCGEQTYSVPAAERGKKVIVGENHVLAAVDHDFTKSSIISFVDLVARKIPETQKKKLNLRALARNAMSLFPVYLVQLKLASLQEARPKFFCILYFFPDRNS